MKDDKMIKYERITFIDNKPDYISGNSLDRWVISFEDSDGKLYNFGFNDCMVSIGSRIKLRIGQEVYSALSGLGLGILIGVASTKICGHLKKKRMEKRSHYCKDNG